MTASAPRATVPEGSASDLATYVSIEVADQLFGIPIERVHDVFVISELTQVPLAPPEIAGLVNLRGRVVTALDLRRCLGLPAAVPASERRTVVGIELGQESYGFVVDAVGEVIRLPGAERDDNPVNLGARWAELVSGIHRIDGRLLVVLDVDALLDLDRTPLAA